VTAERQAINAPDAPAAVGAYVHAVRAGGLLFCSGQIPLDPASGELVEGGAGAQARRCLEIGAFLSFSGIVTFKNAQSVHDVAGWAPVDRILVETDSPYLAPMPLRGRRCEPAHGRSRWRMCSWRPRSGR